MFRFTIRDILWLTALVAMAMVWWIDRTHLIDQAQESRTWEFRAEMLSDVLRSDGYQEVTWHDDGIVMKDASGAEFSVRGP